MDSGIELKSLRHLGALRNWANDKLDLDGDGFYTGDGEWDDCREHNDVNEIVTRDLDCSETDPIGLSYDEAGNLIDDGTDYEYEYDAFYRLRKVYDQTTALVAEYRYNGLNYRIAEHVDTDTDGDVDGSDDWRYFAYDERWRIVASFIESEADPREEFLHHAAGLDGNGDSSYIDYVVMRDRDTDADTTLDERLYYCQNWRADVSAIVDDTGQMMEWAKYSAYGVPFGLPGGDTDSDGDCDSTDITQIQSWIDGPTYDVRGDVDLDGDVDGGDKSIAQSEYFGLVGGHTSLSMLGRRHGLSGSWLSEQCARYFVRHREMSPGLGLWAQRDPLAQIDGPNLYAAFRSSPLRNRDSQGLSSECLGCTALATISSTPSSGPCGFRIEYELEPYASRGHGKCSKNSGSRGGSSGTGDDCKGTSCGSRQPGKAGFTVKLTYPPNPCGGTVQWYEGEHSVPNPNAKGGLPPNQMGERNTPASLSGAHMYTTKCGESWTDYVAYGNANEHALIAITIRCTECKKYGGLSVLPCGPPCTNTNEDY